MVLRGVSWLVTEAVACDFEDNGKDYTASARQVSWVVFVSERAFMSLRAATVPSFFLLR